MTVPSPLSVAAIPVYAWESSSPIKTEGIVTSASESVSDVLGISDAAGVEEHPEENEIHNIVDMINKFFFFISLF